MPKKIVVNGIKNNKAEPAALLTSDLSLFDNFELVDSVLVSNSRSATSRQEIPITSDGDIVELQFEDETTWIGNAQEFHEIFNLSLNRGLDEDAIEIPATLQASGDRGLLKDLAVQAVS